jgi:hypothetical protein
MFDVNETPKPVYWCVVFLDEDHNYIIVKQSEDAILCDLFPDGAYDESLDSVWRNKSAGLYHLKLNPWTRGPDMQGEYDCGVDIIEAICLYTHNNQHEKG